MLDVVFENLAWHGALWTSVLRLLHGVKLRLVAWCGGRALRSAATTSLQVSRRRDDTALLHAVPTAASKSSRNTAPR